ncbi:MAG: PIN domain-containing protein [Burkholderiales bacterium]|nr:PIN domain-containing protein [Burkholderiales bacterium]
MVLADASFFLALANSADRFHAQAVRALEATDEGLVTTWPVLAELSHLLVARLGVDAQLRFLGGAKLMGLRYVDLRGEHWPRLLQLMRKYADLPMDLADASLVLAAEELGDGRILSTDQRDFGVYRWKNRKPFRNLLLEA